MRHFFGTLRVRIPTALNSFCWLWKGWILTNWFTSNFLEPNWSIQYLFDMAKTSKGPSYGIEWVFWLLCVQNHTLLSLRPVLCRIWCHLHHKYRLEWAWGFQLSYGADEGGLELVLDLLLRWNHRVQSLLNGRPAHVEKHQILLRSGSEAKKNP